MQLRRLALPSLLWLLAAALSAKDIKLADGTTYKSARIERVDGATVVLVHEGGEARVPLRRFEPEMQKELLGVTVGSVLGVTTNATRARQRDPDEVVVSASPLPVVERFELTPEDARARRFFEETAKKKKEQDAKKEPTIWNVKAWRYLPPLISLSAEDPNKPSTLKWSLQTGAAQTYGAPDPRTGK